MIEHVHRAIPIVALAVLGAVLVWPPGPWTAAACVLVLIATIGSAVHHAERVAHRVGEPYGTLLLALAVTAIETSLIIALMRAGGPAASGIARDAVFAAIMIIVTGVVGLCLLVGGIRHHVQSFRMEGSSPALGAVVALVTLCFILPGFTVSAPGPTYAPAQLVFAAAASLALWAVYILFQTVRHRDYFLPPIAAASAEAHAAPPSRGVALTSFVLLLVALTAVVGFAKALSPLMTAGLAAVGAPQAAGVAVSLVVMLPETVAALRAALANRLQSSMNLALGSALAAVGLTIPVVAMYALVTATPLTLGLGAKDIVLFAAAMGVASFTLSDGRATVMEGAVHLVLFAAFLFLTLVP